MKIIKYTLNTLAAIFTIGAIFTACSEKELANENEQSLDKKGYTLTIEATKAAPTKALAEAGGNIVASWAKGEKVSVFNSSQVKIGELTAQYSGLSTVLSGELTNAPAVADVLTLEFCSASYTAQDGTLAYIAANCDYATANVTVKTVANNTITTEAHANFVNQQAIVKFTLKNDAAQPAVINLSELTIKVSGSASDVTVTPASAASELYVALPAVANGSIELIGTAAPKTYTYARNGVTFENGKFYPITVNMTSAVAKIGDVKYETLAAAIATVPTDGTKTTITMIANETMATGASITIAATQNVVLDLNGKTVTGNGGLNGASFFLLTNKGTLEITDLSSGKTGKLTGYWTSPNTGYSNQYVTIYNAGGTLTLTAGTVETTSGYLSYAINNTSNAWGVGDDKESVFNMTGGTLTASNGGDAALRVYQNCADTANPFSHNYVTISGGTIASGGIFLDNYIYHPHENTTGEGIITNVTITGGEIHGLIDMKLRHAFHTSINISGGTFVESKLRVRKVNNSDTDRWDPSIENPSSPVFNISGGNLTFVNGCAFGLNYGYNGTDWSSYIPYSVTGGTFSVDPTAYVFDGYEAVDNGNGTWTVQELEGVAQIGSTRYATLAEAIAAVGSDETITLLKDVTQDAGLLYDKANVSAKFNLNNHTFTVNTGSNVNNRAVKINRGSLEVYGGSIVAVGAGTTSSNGTGCYGAFRVEADGSLNAHDLSLTNSRPYGLNVKVLGGTAELSNVTIASSYGGGIEVTEANLGTQSKAGSATLTDCTFTQTGYFDHCSTALSVSGGSSLTINSGSYTSDNYALYVFSSGGVITVKDGTFSGDKNGIAIIAAIDTNTYPQYTGGLQLQGGNYTGGFSITSPAFMNITGGTYNHNPSAYVASGYEAVDNGNSTWTVQELEGVAQIGESKYPTLAAAFEAAQDGNTITLLADCEVSEALVNTKNVTLDLGSYSISGTVEAYLLQNRGTLVINADNTNPGKIYNVSTAAKGHGAVLNDTEGTITINGGIFGDNDSDHTNTGTVNSGCALRNRGTATVNGGVFTTAEPDYAGVWAYAIVSGESDVAANITINGGHIYGRHGDLCNNHGTMVINDVTTYGTANYYSIYAWKEGTTTVNGGTYVKNSHTPAVNIQFYADEATASIVVKDGNFTKNTAGNFANGNGSVSLQGGTFNLQPEAAIISDGYEAVKSGNLWTVSKVAGVAAIGSQGYSTLAAAFEAAQNGNTITLLADCEVSEALVNTKNITLDLGTYSIIGNVNGKLLTNQGTLTINANSTNPGKIYNTDISAQGHDAVQNNEGATITINGGIFGDSDADITNQNNINRGPGIRNYGTATLNGGKFTAGDNYLNSGWAYAVINQGGSITINSGVTVYGKNNGNIGNTAGDMTVNGGSFTINGPKSHYNIYSSGGSINVFGGTFTKSDYVSEGNEHSFYAENGCTINISGGTFTNTSSTTFKLGGGTVSVTGGTFNKQPEAAIIANGYAAVDNGDGTWTVVEAQ